MMKSFYQTGTYQETPKIEQELLSVKSIIHPVNFLLVVCNHCLNLLIMINITNYYVVHF